MTNAIAGQIAGVLSIEISLCKAHQLLAENLKLADTPTIYFQRESDRFPEKVYWVCEIHPTVPVGFQRLFRDEDGVWSHDEYSDLLKVYPDLHLVSMGGIVYL